MRKFWIFSVIMSIFIFGCATTEITPPKTQLQIREFQTRTFDTNDIKIVMKAMLNVLQDDGFIVKNAVPDIGLLTAEKTLDATDKASEFWVQLGVAFGGRETPYRKAQIIECTANISEFGKQSRVRVNFQVKVLDQRGGIMEVKQIDDEKYYQDFFSKVDKGLFIQKEKL
ncbi:hypothetical protein [Thermodesulfovibrio sp. 3462-1]|uniref:Uncharacterized protein n=1 Tax=Thermodesulfovibrio obliviosus TaxID=3118332 RepID=A0AAU8H2U3_9BACT